MKYSKAEDRNISIVTAFSWFFLAVLGFIYLLDPVPTAFMVTAWICPLVAIAQLITTFYFERKLLSGKIPSYSKNIVIVGIGAFGGLCLAIIVIYLWLFIIMEL